MKFAGTYSISGAPHQPAEISLLDDKLVIQLLLEDKSSRKVFWYYDQVSEDPNNDLVFMHLDYPPQLIHLASADAANDIRQRVHASKKEIFTRRRSVFFKVALGLVFFFAVAFFWFVPWISGQLANRFPMDYEKQIGDQMFQSIQSTMEVDDAKTLYLNDFFSALEISSRYDMRITVVKNAEANAFAMPGGHIVVYDKIIEGLGSYPELAALLAHEYVHVQNRHSLKSLFRSLSTSIFFALVIGDASAVGNVLISNADNLKNMSYSRSLEREADEEGSALLLNRKIDCNGFVRLFQFLQKESKVEISEWASSHPDLNKRIRYIRQNKNCRQQSPQPHPVLEALFRKLKHPS